MSSPSITTPPPPRASENKTKTKNDSARRPKRRHHHKKRGKSTVIATMVLIAAYVGFALALSIKGQTHPLLVTWGQITQLTFHSLISGVVLLCLFQFFRGSVSVKQVMGITATLATAAFTVLITFSFVQGNQTLWTIFEATGLVLGIYVTWVCFFSRGAASFMNYQQDHH